MPHRISILREYIDNHENTSRGGFNCYIDATLITIRSLCGLLGFEADSRKVIDMADPNQSIIKFAKFAKIRANLDPSIIIINIKNKNELESIPEWQEIIVALNAANKCVAHFDEFSDLEHEATPDIVAKVAKAIIREVSARITN